MGVTKQHISGGDGVTSPKAGDHVVCEYVGMLANGVVFDGSHGPGKQPFSFEVGVKTVVLGLDQGIRMLTVGEKAILTSTPDFAYGPAGFPPMIPPDSTLIFEIKLLSIS